MNAERYLNHPTFGMLYRVAPAGKGREIYATLYTQRMYFMVALQPRGIQFEVIPLQDARYHAELHLSRCRRTASPDFLLWQELFNQTFL